MKVKIWLALSVVCATFAQASATTMYVDPASTGAESPFTSAATAASNLTDAVTAAQTLATADDPVEIRVAKGTYTETNFTLDKPITVVGATGDPADVEIVDNAGGTRAFTISDANAAVRYLTISGGGYRRDRKAGGHVYMSAGLVERCVIRDGIAGAQCNGNYEAGYGGNVWMSGGRLVSCEIRGGKTSGACKGWTSTGSGVHAEGGTIDSCLFYGNGVTSGYSYGGGLYAKGSTVVANCSFIDNVAANSRGGGIYVDSANVKVVNCVFFGNGGTLDKEIGAKNHGCFAYCASSVTNDSCATWRIVSRDDFAGYEAHDVRTANTSALVNGGTRDSAAGYPSVAATTDVAGSGRISGMAIDIGCYEIDENALSVSGYASTYLAYENTNVTFTAKARGTAGSVTYRWDFGDGTVTTTANATYERAWATAGLYTVRVAASDDGGSTWSAWYALPVKVRVVPAEMFVDPKSTNPTAPYRTRETAAHTFAAAFLEMTNNVSGGYAYSDRLCPTIRLCKGTISETSMTLKYGIRIVGDTGDPADAIINDNVQYKRGFVIQHSDALLKDLTITGSGIRKDLSEGGHVYMSSGTIEHCVIRGGIAGAKLNTSYGGGSGGNVYMTGGRMVRCEIINGMASSYYATRISLGDGVCATGGTIDSCLVRDSGTLDAKCKGGGIYASGSTRIVNCTVVDNKAGNQGGGGGIWVDSASVCVANCVFYNNGGTLATEIGPNNQGRFFHCASSVTNESCAFWPVIGENDFTAYASKDFTLVPSSAMRDAGSQDAAWCPALLSDLDLAGGARVSGAAVDIGCYEIDQSKVSFGGNLSSYIAFEGSNVTCSASAVGGSGTYVFRWNFGNGESVDTTETAYVYAYPAAGLFSVSLAVSDDGGETWSDSTVLATKIVVAAEVMYVDAACATPTFPYKTKATAAKTLSAAIAALTNTVSGGVACVPGATIRLCTGTHTAANVTMSTGIRIVGDTGDPADVVVNDDVQGKRAFTLKHADALVRDLTIIGSGYRVYQSGGGHISMSAGLVENCIIQNGIGGWKANDNWDGGYGGNVAMSGGRLLRCQIYGGQAAPNYNGGGWKGGAGIHASGGIVESCLVKGNGKAGVDCTGGGIYADGSATIVNCTVVDNAAVANGGGGIYVASASARVVNTALFGNGGTAKNEFGTANLGRFFHCASSVTNDSCATWQIVGESDFTAYASQDYTLVPSSVMKDVGSQDATWCPSTLSEFDLAGNDRVSGKEIDVGCYEIDQSKVSFGGNLSSYVAFEGSNVTFNASAVGGSGEYVFRWNFGNGVSHDTAETAHVYAYPAAGLFAVSLSVSDDDGETWFEPTVLATKIVIAAETMFVDAASENPTFPYKTKATAAAKISDALAALTNTVSSGLACVPGATIRLCKGTHTATGMMLSTGIRVIGDTGDPADVIVNDDTRGTRAFTLTHTDALVRDLTICGKGLRIYTDGGGHIYMTAGTVENCVIRDGIAGWEANAYWDDGYGGNVAMTGGRIVRCQIYDGKAATLGAGNGGKRGHGIYATGGLIESCLVKGNCGANGGANSAGGGIYADGNATVLNCTLVGNAGTANGGGICVAGSSVRVVNTVIYDNGGTSTAEFGTANLGCFQYCASSVTNESCGTWRVVDAAAFRDYAGVTAKFPQGIRPKNLVRGLTGPLIDAGCDWSDYLSIYGGIAERDLLGGPRLVGRRLDIGCLEAFPDGTQFLVR